MQVLKQNRTKESATKTRAPTSIYRSKSKQAEQRLEFQLLLCSLTPGQKPENKIKEMIG